MDSIGTAASRAIQRATASQSSQRKQLNELAVSAKFEANGLPVKFDRECDVVLPRRLFSAWIPDEGPRAITRELEPAERALLESRAAALEIALEPFADHDRESLTADLGAMFSGFRYMRQRGEDALSVVEITLAVLREFPAWAIRKACLSIAQARANLSEKFAPNDAEIYGVVEDIVKQYREHHRQANALLSAPVEQPMTPYRPTLAEIEDSLGRPLGEPKMVQVSGDAIPVDGKHAQRIAADLEARRSRNEALKAKLPELKSEGAE